MHKMQSVFKKNQYWPQIPDHEIYLTNNKYTLKNKMINFKKSQK